MVFQGVAIFIVPLHQLTQEHANPKYLLDAGKLQGRICLDCLQLKHLLKKQSGEDKITPSYTFVV